MSIYALNLINGLGLGLAIDYSLFMVSRFREELARRGRREAALQRDACAPRAGRSRSARSRSPPRWRRCSSSASASCTRWASAACICALVAAAVSLTLLPALLGALGERVNAGGRARWKDAIGARGARRAQRLLVPPLAARDAPPGRRSRRSRPCC